MSEHHPIADPRRWLALPVLLTGAFLPPLDFFIVNVALPSIRASFHASEAQLQFVISAYAATYAVFLITGGRLGDLFGRRRLFLAGISGFTLASLLCGLAWSPQVLLGGRMLQGLAAAALAPQVLASIRAMFPGAEQPRALGLYVATFGMASTLGQLLGGALITGHWWGLGWQLIFLVNLPVGLAALAGGLWLLRESHVPDAPRLDLAGVALLSLALALLIYPLVEGREQGWPAWTFVMLGASLLALAAFVRYELRLVRHGRLPLIDVTLFRHGDFALGVLITLGFYLTSSFVLTFAVYQQSGLRHDAMQAGLATLPFTLGYFAGSVGASRAGHRLGRRALPLFCSVQALGFVLVIADISGAAGGRHLLDPGLAIAGVGFGVSMPALIKVVIGSLAPRHAGLASGVVITALQVSAALGVAIIGGVFYSVLGQRGDEAAYAHAFVVGLACNVGMLLAIATLALALRHPPAETADAAPMMAPD